MWTKVPRWTRRTGSKGGGLALSVTAYAVPPLPRGRGLGKEMKFAWTERVSTLNGSHHKQIYNKKRNTLWKSTT
jgi:hypothetical protein